MALTSFDMPKLHISEFSPEKCVSAYDAEGDILKLSVDPGRPATSIDVSGAFWLRADPASGEVLGFEVEGFQTCFLKNRSELPGLWARDPEGELVRKCALALLREVKAAGLV